MFEFTSKRPQEKGKVGYQISKISYKLVPVFKLSDQYTGRGVFIFFYFMFEKDSKINQKQLDKERRVNHHAKLAASGRGLRLLQAHPGSRRWGHGSLSRPGQGTHPFPDVSWGSQGQGTGPAHWPSTSQGPDRSSSSRISSRGEEPMPVTRRHGQNALRCSPSAHAQCVHHLGHRTAGNASLELPPNPHPFGQKGLDYWGWEPEKRWYPGTMVPHKPSTFRKISWAFIFKFLLGPGIPFQDHRKGFNLIFIAHSL